LIEAVLAESGAALRDVDLFAATVGPGGFTGVRIGLATLRGLALAAARPMLGITSFEALAYDTDAEERRGRLLLVAIESKRAELYVQMFGETLVPESEPLLLLPAQIAVRFTKGPLLVAGDASLRLMADLSGYHLALYAASRAACIDAAVVASIAAERAGAAGNEAPAPLYLREPDVTPPHRELP
jgi:tRNA threonylcarbamoyladenosine biosynthesis protein TsaB